MLKITKTLFLILMAAFFIGCGGKKDGKNTKTTQAEEIDTLFLNPKASSIDIERYRIFATKNEILRLGKLGRLKLSVDNLSLNASTSYKVDSGFVVYNKKTFIASCFIRTSQVVTPKVDSAKTFVIGTPNYLLNKKSKYIRFDFKGNFYPHEQPPTASVFLALGDTTGLITESNAEIKIAYADRDKVKEISTGFYLNGIKWHLFDDENKNEVVKDSIVGQLKLVFDE